MRHTGRRDGAGRSASEHAEKAPTCCGFVELAEELDVGKATVSHPLKELRRAGLPERVQ